MKAYQLQLHGNRNIFSMWSENPYNTSGTAEMDKQRQEMIKRSYKQTLELMTRREFNKNI